MDKYITLLGAEDVQRAASTMSSAASEMQNAANQIDHSLEMFIRRFQEQVDRLEVIMGEREG